MIIRKLGVHEASPMELLSLADPSTEMILRYATDGERFVAETEGEVVGVMILKEIAENTIEIMNIAVAEEMQGLGIGKMLVQHAIAWAKESDYKNIEIGTGNSSIGQLALYQKCGFRISHVLRDFFIENYDEEIYENGIQCRDMIRLSREL